MKRKLIVKILGFSTLFLIMVFIFFPVNNLKGYIFERVYSQSGILLVPESIYFTLFGLPGVGMKNVGVTLPLGDQELDLWSRKVTLQIGRAHV